MKQPNSIDPLEWARYNEWVSGARVAVIASEEPYNARESKDDCRQQDDNESAAVTQRSLGAVAA